MRYREELRLKDNRRCVLRTATGEDAARVLEVFKATHAESDYLRTYPDEAPMPVEEEASWLDGMAQSDDEIEVLAEIDGVVVGSGGFTCVGRTDKVRHRAEFGVSVRRAYWGLGIGRALTEACIALAREAGYVQLELDVVADNERAWKLYEQLGFVEYGRNPYGFRTREGGWQQLVLMRLALSEERGA